jgi:hypothetical protein
MLRSGRTSVWQALRNARWLDGLRFSLLLIYRVLGPSPLFRQPKLWFGQYRHTTTIRD